MRRVTKGTADVRCGDYCQALGRLLRDDAESRLWPRAAAHHFESGDGRSECLHQRLDLLSRVTRICAKLRR